MPGYFRTEAVDQVLSGSDIVLMLTEGMLYGIMVLGVFITFRILDFPDLTVDGSFPFGAAIFASCVTAGCPPWIALVIAFFGGIAAGSVTAAIHNYLRVPNLLAGILTMTILWSVNIRVMNAPNLQLIRQPTILKDFQGMVAGIPPEVATLIFVFIFAIIVKLLLDLFFRTDMGLTLGALGNNPQMVISTGIDPRLLKFVGLGLSNGLVAVAGALSAQFQGFADVSLGQGIIIAGLASVMIGEFLIRSNRIWVLTLRVLLGSIVFRALMYLARKYGYDIGLLPTDQKLLSGLLIIIALTVSQLSKQKKRALGQNGNGQAKTGESANLRGKN